MSAELKYFVISYGLEVEFFYTIIYLIGRQKDENILGQLTCFFDNTVRCAGDSTKQFGTRSGIAASFGATAEVVFDRAYPATVIAAEATEFAACAARSVAGAARVQHMADPTMGGEDFAFMLQKKQGSYIMLGAGRTADDPMPHHPKYDFNDAVLPVGASYWATLTEQLLAKG